MERKSVVSRLSLKHNIVRFPRRLCVVNIIEGRRLYTLRIMITVILYFYGTLHDMNVNINLKVSI